MSAGQSRHTINTRCTTPSAKLGAYSSPINAIAFAMLHYLYTVLVDKPVPFAAERGKKDNAKLQISSFCS